MLALTGPNQVMHSWFAYRKGGAEAGGRRVLIAGSELEVFRPPDQHIGQKLERTLLLEGCFVKPRS